MRENKFAVHYLRKQQQQTYHPIWDMRGGSKNGQQIQLVVMDGSETPSLAEMGVDTVLLKGNVSMERRLLKEGTQRECDPKRGQRKSQSVHIALH